MNQKRALIVTLVIFLVTFIQTQLIWYGYGLFINGYGGLIIVGGLSVISFVALVIQTLVYWVSKWKNRK